MADTDTISHQHDCTCKRLQSIFANFRFASSCHQTAAIKLSSGSGAALPLKGPNPGLQPGLQSLAFGVAGL
jgi:hypothetical protein